MQYLKGLDKEALSSLLRIFNFDYSIDQTIKKCAEFEAANKGRLRDDALFLHFNPGHLNLDIPHMGIQLDGVASPFTEPSGKKDLSTGTLYVIYNTSGIILMWRNSPKGRLVYHRIYQDEFTKANEDQAHKVAHVIKGVGKVMAPMIEELLKTAQ